MERDDDDDMKRIKLDEDEVTAADQKKAACVPNFIEILPESIGSTIFSLLPLKSVINCLCVKKSWNKLLTSSDFGEKHLHKMMEEDREAATGLLLLIKRWKSSSYLHIHLAEYNREANSYQVTQIPSPPWPSKWPSEAATTSDSKFMMRYTIVGSINGLICLARRICVSTVDYDPVYICNPMLKECLDLPALTNYSHKDSLKRNLAMGFGFYTTTNDKGIVTKKQYKILRIYYREQPELGEVQIYTLGGGEREWKSIGNTNYMLQSSKPGVLVAGTLYWLINNNDPVIYQLVSFDLETESFQQLPLPTDMPIPDADTSSQLIDFGGEGKNLCLAHVNDGEGDLQFWILINGGDWIRKVLSLNTTGEFHGFRPYYLKNGVDEVLLSCATLTREVVLAISRFDINDDDDDDDDNELVEVLRMDGKRRYDVVPHTKSFVSLKAMGEEGRMMP